MNVSGVMRGYLCKSFKGEKFLLHVAETMEKQLKEWDPQYEVFLMKLANYELMIKKGETYYHVLLSEQEIEILRGPSHLTEKSGWNCKTKAFQS